MRKDGGLPEISLVMPYWLRADALRQNLETLRALYNSDIEIIVVDDGSPEPAEGDARIIRLPAKNHALNPCVPFNIGVENANGKYIVLTNPEVLHKAPILDQMREEVDRLGPKAYVAAACWSEKLQKWFCHTGETRNMGRGKMPEGAGLHFCSMLRKDFYEEIGGFHEAYRDGQAFDDNDILWKLDAAGAVFCIRDDLVTHHITCPPCKWPQGGHARNRKIFEARWG